MKRDLKNPLASTFGDDPTSKKGPVDPKKKKPGEPPKNMFAAPKLNLPEAAATPSKGLGKSSRLIATKNQKYPKRPDYPVNEKADFTKDMDPDRVKKTIADIDELRKDKTINARDASMMKQQLLGGRGYKKEYGQTFLQKTGRAMRSVFRGSGRSGPGGTGKAKKAQCKKGSCKPSQNKTMRQLF